MMTMMIMISIIITMITAHCYHPHSTIVGQSMDMGAFWELMQRRRPQSEPTTEPTSANPDVLPASDATITTPTSTLTTSPSQPADQLPS